jgi:hypothetical protein
MLPEELVSGWFPSAARLSVFFLIRSFACPPRDGFAFYREKLFARYTNIMPGELPRRL